MLFGVKNGLIDRLEEKMYNARINVWMRSPGLLLSCFTIYVAALYGPTDSVCTMYPFTACAIAFLVYLNGQYYMQVVVGNTFRKAEAYNS